MKIRANGKATKEQIEQLEKDFDIVLPDDYKAFLREYNGGVVEDGQEAVYLPQIEERVDIDILNGIETGRKGSDIYFSMKWADNLPSQNLIIGRNIYSCELILIADGENDGIWFWDSERTLQQSSDEENVFFVCDTFTEFLNGGSNPKAGLSKNE